MTTSCKSGLCFLSVWHFIANFINGLVRVGGSKPRGLPIFYFCIPIHVSLFRKRDFLYQRKRTSANNRNPFSFLLQSIIAENVLNHHRNERQKAGQNDNNRPDKRRENEEGNIKKKMEIFFIIMKLSLKKYFC